MENIISFISNNTTFPFTSAALSSDDAQNPDETIEQVIQTEDFPEPPPTVEILES